MDKVDKPAKRRNKFVGKEDVSRATVDNIISTQIDRLREISRISDDAATKLQESVDVLYNKQIPVNTEKFEQLKREFTHEMKIQVKKIKQPSRGLKWYIVMWLITLASSWLGGYFIHEYREWKKEALYWYNESQKPANP